MLENLGDGGGKNTSFRCKSVSRSKVSRSELLRRRAIGGHWISFRAATAWHQCQLTPSDRIITMRQLVQDASKLRRALSLRLCRYSSQAETWFSHVEEAPKDPILGKIWSIRFKNRWKSIALIFGCCIQWSKAVLLDFVSRCHRRFFSRYKPR